MLSRKTDLEKETKLCSQPKQQPQEILWQGLYFHKQLFPLDREQVIYDLP